MRLLITGGAGYIGSHLAIEFIRKGHDIFILDNFSNSSREVVERIRQLTNANFGIYEGDVRNAIHLSDIFSCFEPEAVVHLAGLKAVSESTNNPVDYYSHNVTGLIELLKLMKQYDCRCIVFSSSATIYGEAEYLPYDEDHPLNPTNPYGRTKYFSEQIILDWAYSWSNASAVLLRYFNPIGADASGLIGENPNGTPNNLLPYISQVAAGFESSLDIFGNNYNTRDGTGERDYIHISDLARAHLSAVLFAISRNGCEAINVGTGQGTTVLEMVKAFEKASGCTIPYKIVAEREGDVARSLAAVVKAECLLGWRARLSIDDMCNTAWRWQSNNPRGYTP